MDETLVAVYAVGFLLTVLVGFASYKVDYVSHSGEEYKPSNTSRLIFGLLAGTLWPLWYSYRILKYFGGKFDSLKLG